MKEETFIEKLCECLMEDPKDITISSELDSVVGWDSVGRLLTACMILDTFNMDISTSTIINCKTVGDIVRLVEDKLEV